MSSGPITVESTSSSLLRRVQQRDAAAWTRFTQLYGPLVYFWARQAGLQPADAADILQEVFRAVIVGIDGFRQRDGGRFRGWMLTITHNKVRDHFRRARGQAEPVGGSDAHQRLLEIPESDDVEFPLSSRAQLVRQALHLISAEFEPDTWQAFWQTAVDQRSPADVADDLGKTLAAVYQARTRVFRRLREELADLL